MGNGIRIEEINVKDESLKEEISRRYGQIGVVKLWALKRSLRGRWASIDEGDCVMLYHGGSFVYAAKVAFKYPFQADPWQVEVGEALAESVWGRDVKGETWPYLIFLTEVKEISLPLQKLNELTGYRLSYVAGFMKVQEEKSREIIDYLQRSALET
ncbi:TPA: hypothetical protein EYP26_03530 [Candidatus Bathyarchaeota archaeon]|nr:hypothetical protein [Candidatus Bathyarchaeota archaeon]